MRMETVRVVIFPCESQDVNVSFHVGAQCANIGTIRLGCPEGESL